MQVTARRNASLPPSPSKNNAEEVLRRGAIETSRPAARPASNALINFAAENFPIIKSDEHNFPVTRSDGTVGHMRLPDQKEVRKLVGYIRDGMNRADRSNRQGQLGSGKFLRIRK